MRKRTIARECALKILYQIDIRQELPEDVIQSFWESWPEDNEVREFTEKIVLGTCKSMEVIDSKIIKYTENWQINRMAVVDRNILRLAVYELLYIDDIPPKVTINEAVNIAKRYSQDEAGKFVNGVLDKIHHTESPKSKSEQTNEESQNPEKH